MRKILLNLVPGEPLALVQELASFDNPIQLDLLSASVLDLHVHDIVCGGMLVGFNPEHKLSTHESYNRK